MGGRGTRRVEVSPERLSGWLDGFAARHGQVSWDAASEQVTLTAEDGARAVCAVPFPPLDVDPDTPFGGLVRHACAERRVGVLLVRLGGHAVGVFEGTRLVASKVGSRHVQGRSAAGGWSQQRFARRRAHQATQAYAATTDVAVRILVPQASALDAVVTGGDRRAVAAVLADPRLAVLGPRVSGRLLDVPDPRRKILDGTPRLFRAVTVAITDPTEPSTIQASSSG
ncbi:MAG: acVLRF1 family peptidyl-tRNA hydrolase [Actinomycetes bacterium]